MEKTGNFYFGESGNFKFGITVGYDNLEVLGYNHQPEVIRGEIKKQLKSGKSTEKITANLPDRVLRLRSQCEGIVQRACQYQEILEDSVCRFATKST